MKKNSTDTSGLFEVPEAYLSRWKKIWKRTGSKIFMAICIKDLKVSDDNENNYYSLNIYVVIHDFKDSINEFFVYKQNAHSMASHWPGQWFGKDKFLCHFNIL
jgi:hypothetical protein